MKSEATLANTARVCLLATILLAFSAAASAQDCENWAKAVSVKGTMEVKRAGETQWSSVRIGDTLCPGDSIRTGELSSAGVRLHDGATVQIDQNAGVIFPEVDEKRPLLIRLLEGAALFFSRDPRRLEVDTPFVSAAVEGTEFFVKVDFDRSSVTVYSGRVRVSNDLGSLVLASGESAEAEKGKAPKRVILVRPRDAVQWALYYPPISDFHPGDFPPPARPAVEKSRELHLDGDISGAVKALEEVPVDSRGPRFFAYRAGLYLLAGRVDEAKTDIEAAKRSEPALGLSLLSIVETAQNEQQKALELANEAVAEDSGSAAAWSAMAYARQALFDLKGALEAQRKAVALQGQKALNWARLAELHLAFGDLDLAGGAVQNAVRLDPDVARTQTVLGFAYLTKFEVELAAKAFEKAILLDQGDPMPRLGLGLARIRRGDLEQGREELEIAASLDPDNALVRSYLGKAYYEEKNDKLAAKQYAAAKELDPNDPTPWLYGAIQKRTQNDPVEALRDIQKSIELNDNRAVYRSSLLLDRDLATRSAGLARIYDDLGFEQLALTQGWKSLESDPGNYSAHRFLADSYAALPRHETARVSELLQAQLLQPLNVNPVQPQTAEVDSYILQEALPSRTAYNEYSPLFERDRFAFQANALAGSNSTFSEDIAQSGLFGRYSYSLGQYHYETDGFRDNNDQDKDIYDIFAQAAISHKTSILAEYRYDDFEYGDLRLRFYPEQFSDARRTNELARSMRVGLKHEFTPRSVFLLTGICNDLDGDLYDAASAIIQDDGRTLKLSEEGSRWIESDGYMTEAQHILTADRFNLVSGFGYFYSETSDSIIYTQILEDLNSGQQAKRVSKMDGDSDERHTNFYTNCQIHMPKEIEMTLGFNVDLIDSPLVEDNFFSPKLGLTWGAFPGTTLRAAVFRSVQRSLISHQTIQPTQVAGFNQLFYDLEGTESWRYGLGADQKISDSLYAGAEFSTRDLKAPGQVSADGGGFRLVHYDWDEDDVRAYLYWTPASWMSFGLQYFYERQKTKDDVPTASVYRNLKTHRLPLSVNFFSKSGLSSRIGVSYVEQTYGFLQNSESQAEDSDCFWLVDAGLSYRLPKRLGLVSVEVKNLFDENFNYQDTDPGNPRFFPEREFFCKFTLAF